MHSVITEKHSCWICREEMSSEALLLQHYENQGTHVCEDDSVSENTLSCLLRFSSIGNVLVFEQHF